MSDDKTITSIKQACEYYNKKHNINIAMQESDKVDLKYNRGKIYSNQDKQHFAGFYLLKSKTGIPYCIFFDSWPTTFSSIQDNPTEKLKEQLLKKVKNIRFIHIGKHFQKDDKSCMVFALKGIEMLAKKHGKLAGKIVNYCNKLNCNKQEFFFQAKKKNDKLIDGYYDISKAPFGGEFIKLAQSYKLQKEYGNLLCTGKEQTKNGKAYGRKVKMRLKKYLKNHSEKTEIYNINKGKFEMKNISNKINNLYKKLKIVEHKH